MNEASDEQISGAAVVLIDAQKGFATGWKDMESATAEVVSFRSPDRFAFPALDGVHVSGWIGAIRHTSLMWELHALVVAPDRQRTGVGTALVQKLEAEASDQHVSTIYLRTDDDFGGTNIYGKDLYPDVLGRLSALEPVSGHPYTFYHKMGYSVVGVIPDASGFGKHDILMAKRIREPHSHTGSQTMKEGEV